MALLATAHSGGRKKFSPSDFDPFAKHATHSMGDLEGLWRSFEKPGAKA